jgi:hypothetical protein
MSRAERRSRIDHQEKRMRTVAIVLSVLMLSSPALAQSNSPRRPSLYAQSRALPTLSDRIAPAAAFEQSAQKPPRRPRSTTRKVLGGIAGGVGGFFGGGYLGAALEPDCNCDDPGFKGFLIGAPIGAVAGAILGAKYF